MKLDEFKLNVMKLKGPKEWDYIANSDAYKIYTASEEEQLKAVQSEPYNIEYIKNPTEKVQLEAVKQSPFVIEYIDNPSEELQLLAVKNDATAIEIIDNPTDKVIEEALKNVKYKASYNHFLRHIENNFEERRNNLNKFVLREINQLIEMYREGDTQDEV